MEQFYQILFMITKLCYLSSEGALKLKMFKVRQEYGIKEIKSQFCKYDPCWSQCHFYIYYQEHAGIKKVISNDEQLHRYLKENKNSKIWAEKSQVSLLYQGEQFQDLNVSQMVLNYSEKYPEKVESINNSSLIINQNEPPSLPKNNQWSDNVINISELKDDRDFFKKVRKQKHFGVSCGECYLDDIEGIRYHCLICYGYDICQKCEGRIEHQHPLVKIVSPEKMFRQHHLEIIQANISTKIMKNSIKQQYEQKIQNLKGEIEELKSNYLNLLGQLQKSNQQDMIKNPEQKKSKQIKSSQRQGKRIDQIIKKTGKQQNKFGENISMKIPKPPPSNKQADHFHIPHPFRRIYESQSLQQIQKERKIQIIMQKADSVCRKLNIPFNKGLELAKRHSNISYEEIIAIYLSEDYN